jgi:hypothetical protein
MTAKTSVQKKHHGKSAKRRSKEVILSLLCIPLVRVD